MPERILIVEDEKTLAEKWAEKLKAEKYEVSMVHDGEEGWQTIQAEKPDLVVLDIMMPNLDGITLCRFIRNEPALESTRVIMVTARGTEVDKIIGLESGADDYITKPFGLGEFLARIRAVLRRPIGASNGRQDQILSNDLVLNLTGRRLFLDGDEVKLSNKEFDLLKELMQNKDAVLSRDLILTKVWGYDTFVDKRTVDVHIRWLREKIELDPSNPQRIKTVRGVGYRFEG
jgi:DNA-binding response OmpR family regulator